MIQTFADNRVQFDGNDMTWALRRSGSVTVASGKLTVPASRGSIVALAGDIGKVAVVSAATPNSRTFAAADQNGKAVNYFVFEEVACLVDMQSCFSTANAKGEVTFASDLYPLKTLALIDRGQNFVTDKSSAYVQIASRIMVVDVTDYPTAAIMPTRINSLMRATNRMSGSSFWFGM